MSQISQIRRGGERRQTRFDPAKHAGIIYRCSLCGDDHEGIADRVGITVQTLHRWANEHEQVRTALEAGRDADSLLVEAAFRRALGDRDEDGKYKGGDPGLLKFLLQTRLGYDPARPLKRGAEAKAVKESELGSRLAEVTKLLESLVQG